MQTLILKVEEMQCNHCTSKITTFVTEIQGVKEIQCNLSSKEVTVSFETPATKEQIIEAIEECGFEVSKTSFPNS